MASMPTPYFTMPFKRGAFSITRARDGRVAHKNQLSLARGFHKRTFRDAVRGTPACGPARATRHRLREA